MNQNIAPHKKKEFVSKPFKFIIAAASVAGTLGLWGIFSQTDVKNAAVQSTDAALPTLATLVSVNSNASMASASANGSATSLNLLPVVNQPTQSSVNSAPAVIYNPPAPITSTRSSR